MRQAGAQDVRDSNTGIHSQFGKRAAGLLTNFEVINAGTAAIEVRAIGLRELIPGVVGKYNRALGVQHANTAAQRIQRDPAESIGPEPAQT